MSKKREGGLRPAPDNNTKNIFTIPKFPCLKGKTKQQIQPTHKEINQFLQAIQRQKPSLDLQTAINIIYERAVCDEESRAELYRILEQKQQSQRRKMQIRQRKIIYADSFQMDGMYDYDEKNRFLEKQIAARALCYRGTGQAAWKQEMRNSPLKDKLDEGRYKTIVESIGTETYRRIQKIIRQELKIKTSKLNREHLRISFSLFLRCRQFLPQQQCKTYLNIVKAAYGLQRISFTSKSLISMYKAIRSAIKARVIHRSNEKKPQTQTMSISENINAPPPPKQQQPEPPSSCSELDRQWNKQMQQVLIDSYLTEQNFNVIKQYFKETYPQLACIFTNINLRARLQKTIRSHIRRIREHLTKIGKQDHRIFWYNDFQVRHIIRSAQCHAIRIQMLDYFLGEKESDEAVRRLADDIVAIIEEKEENRDLVEMLEEKKLGGNKSIKSESKL